MMNIYLFRLTVSTMTTEAALNRNRGIDAVFIDVDEAGFSSAVDAAKIDLAFIALHGRFGEDGTAQRALEGKNIM